MENVIRKLYGMYMDNDNGEENEMSEIHDDLCKAKKEAAYQCYQKLRVQLTDELAEELDELMNKHMEIYPQELEESFARFLVKKQNDCKADMAILQIKYDFRGLP